MKNKNWNCHCLQIWCYIFISVQFSRSVMSLRPHGLQHDRLPYPSPTPGTYSNSCPLSRWCHPTISSSVVPFSSCLLLNLLAVQGTLKSLLQHHSSKASSLWQSAFSIVQLSHSYMTTGKTIALTRQIFVTKVIALHFNMLSRLVIAFLPRSKRLLISWLQSPSAVILETPKMKLLTVSIVSPSICHEVMGPDAKISICWMLSFKPTFSLPLSLSSRGFLVPLHFLP